MPDEITPEQWRAWRDDPCTKRVVAIMEDWERKYLGWVERARGLAIAHLDGQRAGIEFDQERRAMEAAREAAGTTRQWLNAIRGEDAGVKPADPADGRRVTVKG